MGSEIEDEGRLIGLAQRLAHLLPWLTGVILVHTTAEGLGLLERLSWSVYLPLTIVIKGIWVVGVTIALVHTQSTKLCLRCMEDVPAEAPVRVNRWWIKPFLFIEHMFWNRWLFILLIMGIFFVPAVVSQLTDSPSLRRVFGLPIDLVLIAWIYSAWPHHRYQPWCPWCRPWDEGGEAEVVPDPDPAGTKAA